MKNSILWRSAFMAAGLTAGLAALAADPPPSSDNQVVVPQVDRRPVKPPHFPSNDFELGLFGGVYATQNFGTSGVGGVRLGYHITEDFFVEGVGAITKVSDSLFRQILPGGIFAKEKENLVYYNISVGYNVLPGEVFVGSRWASPTQLYLIAGVGSTKFAQQQRPTFNFGMGWRLLLTDYAALQVDLRDHVFSLDLLGSRQSTNNIELTAGITAFF
jgi:outer membrane beta-barrel protein